MYGFESESTLYCCPNVKELLALSRRNIWSLSDFHLTRTQNHLALKRTLKHLAKLAKWLRCVRSTYLKCAFACMFLSCHVPISEWIHNLQLSECEGIPCCSDTQYLKFKWLQLDSNQESLTSKTNSKPFAQTGRKIEVFPQYLSVPCNWLYILVMSRNRFKVNPHSRVGWMSRNSLLQAGTKSEL